MITNQGLAWFHGMNREVVLSSVERAHKLKVSSLVLLIFCSLQAQCLYLGMSLLSVCIHFVLLISILIECWMCRWDLMPVFCARYLKCDRSSAKPTCPSCQRHKERCVSNQAVFAHHRWVQHLKQGPLWQAVSLIWSYPNRISSDAQIRINRHILYNYRISLSVFMLKWSILCKAILRLHFIMVLVWTV